VWGFTILNYGILRAYLAFLTAFCILAAIKLKFDVKQVKTANRTKLQQVMWVTQSRGILGSNANKRSGHAFSASLSAAARDPRRLLSPSVLFLRTFPYY
jgi:hypothetical protein